MRRRRRDAYANLDRKSQIALVSWTGFTVTFTAVRALTWAIRNDVGPFRNVSLGGAHIHQRSFYVGAVAVVGEADGIGSPIAEQGVARRQLPQPRRLHGPTDVRAHQSIVDFTVDGKLFCMDQLQSVLLRAFEHDLRRFIEGRGGGYTVQLGQTP